APESLYRAVNIAGTANVAAFGIPMIQVSTAYVCGTGDGRILETSTGTAFVNGYEASKAAAEAIVRSSGTRFAIARPSVVVGDSTSGATSRFENIYMIFKLIAERRVHTLPAAPGASLDLVPIDHVCTGLVAMVEDFARAEGQTLHLVGTTATPLQHLGQAIAAVPGLGAPRFVAPSDFVPEALPATERRYHAAAAALYTRYLLRAPTFDTTTAAALVPPCPATDRAWLDRLIAFAIAQKFVTPRRLNARQDTAPPATSA
ncbi:MAG: SDR family oxidoreductase, partial [Sandarakinorhabdus sp.]|nr:SDR family oxidoreductase [Sandarakinorhabdus sp.]